MRDERGQVGLEDDVHAAGDVGLAVERQPELLGDHAAPAVGADQVLRADLVGRAAERGPARVAVTPSASCSNERNSVLKRSRDPRSPRRATRIGSK